MDERERKAEHEFRALLEEYDQSEGYRQRVEAKRNLIAAFRAALAPEQPSGWISVKDRLPETERIVLTFRPDAHHKPSFDPNVRILAYEGDGNFGGMHKVTHWMTMPDAPSPTKDQA